MDEVLSQEEVKYDRDQNTDTQLLLDHSADLGVSAFMTPHAG
jgi:hypothetical protein